MTSLLDITYNVDDYRFCPSCDLYIFTKENTCPKCGGSVQIPRKQKNRSCLMIYTARLTIGGRTYLVGRDVKRSAKYCQGYRYCVHCSLFFKTDSTRCPICHHRIRSHSCHGLKVVKEGLDADDAEGA